MQKIERQQVEDNRREPENVAPDIRTEAIEEPTGLDTTPPMPPRPEPIQKNQLRTPDFTGDQPKEERLEVSTSHSRSSITINVTLEGIEKFQQVEIELYYLC